MLLNRILFLIPLIFFGCNVNKKKIKNREFSVIVEFNNVISGFTFRDSSDTLLLRLSINNSNSSYYKLLLKDETKEKLINVFDSQFNINEFKFNRKDSLSFNSVTFEISNVNDEFNNNSSSLTALCKHINKNSDVSIEYDNLINYLKCIYPEFKSFPPNKGLKLKNN